MNTEDRHSGTEGGWVVRWQSRIKRTQLVNLEELLIIQGL